MIAFIRPHLSLEAEVKYGDMLYYVNIDVNDNMEPEEVLFDNHWEYTKPLDQVLSVDEADEYTVDKDFSEVLDKMVEFWNANPVWPIQKPEWKTEWKPWVEDK